MWKKIILFIILLASPADAQTFRQLRIEPKPADGSIGIIYVGDSIDLTGFAFTSSGVPVANPGITWTITPKRTHDIRRITSNTGRLVLGLDIGIIRIIGAWSTRSGVFSDTLFLEVRPRENSFYWNPGQQLKIWPRPDSLIRGDTIILKGYARTSAGVPVQSPGIQWSIYPTVLFTAKAISSNELKLNPLADTGKLVIKATWQTSSGAFTDSIITRVALTKSAAFLPWRRGKQLLIDATGTTLASKNDTIRLRVYARTSAGIPVINPGITWESTDIAQYTGIYLNNYELLIFTRDSWRTSSSWFKVSWSTSSGVFKDSVRINTVCSIQTATTDCTR